MENDILTCRPCKGKGTIVEPVDKFMAAITFGFTALIDMGFEQERTKDCSICNGTGYIAKSHIK